MYRTSRLTNVHRRQDGIVWLDIWVIEKREERSLKVLIEVPPLLDIHLKTVVDVRGEVEELI